MAKQVLPVNFKDDILASSMGGKRRYNLIQNDDGTYSLEDVTEYTQTGSDFGAGQINATNQAVNESCDKANVIETMDDIVANQASGMIAGAKAVAELNGNINNKNYLLDQEYSLTYLSIHTSYGDRVDAIKNSLTSNPAIWKEGITICYVISSESDDRGMAIVMKKLNPDGALRAAFQYWDYWGTNEFWCYTNAGWEQH